MRTRIFDGGGKSLRVRVLCRRKRRRTAAADAAAEAGTRRPSHGRVGVDDDDHAAAPSVTRSATSANASSGRSAEPVESASTTSDRQTDHPRRTTGVAVLCPGQSG